MHFDVILPDSLLIASLSFFILFATFTVQTHTSEPIPLCTRKP